MTIWKRLDDWVGTQIDDHLVMIHLESGRYVSLNDTAAEIWAALDAPKDHDALVAALTSKFAVDEGTCSNSLVTLLERMQHLGLVATVG